MNNDKLAGLMLKYIQEIKDLMDRSGVPPIGRNIVVTIQPPCPGTHKIVVGTMYGIEVEVEVPNERVVA